MNDLVSDREYQPVGERTHEFKQAMEKFGLDDDIARSLPRLSYHQLFLHKPPDQFRMGVHTNGAIDLLHVTVDGVDGKVEFGWRLSGAGVPWRRGRGHAQ